MESLQGLVFTELQLPTWQLVLYTVLTCVFILTRRIKSFLLTTCLFALYWTFHLLRVQWLAVVGGEILGPAAYGLFSLILVGVALHAVFFFREGEHFPGFSSYEIGRLRRSLLKRIDQMESAILQAEEKAVHEIRQFEEIKQKLETKVAPLESQLQEMDADLRFRQTAVEDLEKRLLDRIHDLESELAEKEEMLRSRARELETIKSEAEEETRRLRLQLQEAQDRASGLEASPQGADDEINATVRELERQLAAKEALLLARNKEIKDLHAEAREMTEAFNRESQALKTGWEEQESSLREHEEKLVEQLSGLQQEVLRREAELRDRDREIEGLRSELETKTAWLQRQLVDREQAAESKEPLLKEIEALKGKIRELEDQVAEGENRLRERQRQADPRSSAAEERAAALQILLREQEESFARRAASYKEVVESLTGRIQELERQIKEQEIGSSSRSGEKGKGRARAVPPKERSVDATSDPT